MATVALIKTALEGVTIECQPFFGDDRGGVLHVLPGGVENPEGFGASLRDIYAFMASGKNLMRGGHYHLELNEQFIPMAGTGLWILSDFRPESPTFGKTDAVILSMELAEIASDIPFVSLKQKRVPRINVPAGVYHAIIPLTDTQLMTVGLGSTPFVKEDYRYPKLEEIPGLEDILKRANLDLATIVQ